MSRSWTNGSAAEFARLPDPLTVKSLRCQHFTFTIGQFVVHSSPFSGRWTMERTFENWRNAALGLGLTVAVVGTALAVAFWSAS